MSRLGIGQQPEIDAAFERVGGKPLPAADQAERLEQRAGQDRVGERFGRPLEVGAVAIERRDPAPQRVGRGGELRRDLLQQAGGVQLAERLFGVAGAEDLEVFLEQPRRGAPRDLVLQRGDRLEDRLVDRELEPGGEDDRAQHADGVLEEADVGIADAANEPGAEVFEAADVVDDRERRDVVEEGVDREIAAEGVLFRRAVGVVAMNQVVAIAIAVTPPAGLARLRLVVRRQRLAGGDGFGGAGVGQLSLGRDAGVDLPPERRDLDGLGAELDVRQPEPAADDPAVAKELLDLVGMGGRPDVEVFRTSFEQQVTNAPTDEVRDVIMLVEPVKDLESVGIDLATGDRVRGPRYDGRLHHQAVIIASAFVCVSISHWNPST